ncbi:MAG: hypothetical protein FWD42_10605 [Solirubrobacterales bacterium]|nr:hypothetical protein [Solirubrobacterales bacterium]
MRRILAPLAAAVLAGGLAACGGSKPSGAGAGAGAGVASHPTTTTTTTATASAGQPPPGSPSAPADSSPSTPAGGSAGGSTGGSAGSPSGAAAGGDNSITNYGHAANAAVVSRVEATVKSYYAKLAAHDGAGACEFLGRGIKRQLDTLLSRAPALRSRGCAGVIGAFFSTRNPAAASLADVHVHTVRVQGTKAFALISTRASKSSALLMANEAGSWKVNTLVGFPLTP